MPWWLYLIYVIDGLLFAACIYLIFVIRARARTPKEAEEVKKAKEAQTKAKRAREAQAKAKRKAELATGTGVYKGTVTLRIMPPIDLGQMRRLEECLRQIESLHIVLVGGTIDEGGMIVVSLDTPIPLIDVLRAMPPVEQVVKAKKMMIMVVLKSPTAG